MYDENNVFAKILKGELPCQSVFENEHVLAFHDISPSAPIHVLVIPKKPYMSFHDFSEKASNEEIAQFFISVRKVAEMLGLAENGYRLVANHGKDSGQIVPHFHMHILGKTKLGGIS